MWNYDGKGYSQVQPANNARKAIRRFNLRITPEAIRRFNLRITPERLFAGSALSALGALYRLTLRITREILYRVSIIDYKASMVLDGWRLATFSSFYKQAQNRYFLSNLAVVGYPTVPCGQFRKFKLKEYYEIVDEARPLSEFVPTHADYFTEMHF